MGHDQAGEGCAHSVEAQSGDGDGDGGLASVHLGSAQPPGARADRVRDGGVPQPPLQSTGPERRPQACLPWRQHSSLPPPVESAQVPPGSHGSSATPSRLPWKQCSSGLQLLQKQRVAYCW